ncbi:MAG: hypothetical protein JNL38_00045 [Myxococcales bacterium]|nr:hypothetical protein [Myxococcales bacterium]
MHLTSKLGGLVGLAVLTASAAAIFFACGTNGADPMNGGNSSGAPSVDRCATPNDGCACATPGQVVECGKVQSRHGDYVTCSMGTRECGGDGKWGACVGNTVVTKSAGLIHTKALQDGGAACAPGVNDCDPYCNSYTDTGNGVPVGGGLGLADGGIVVIGSGADGGPVVPGGALTTNTGKSTCGAALNLIGGACTPATELTTCRQDSRCNPATNTCEWNGAEGYYKPTAGGIDLTVATSCDAGGGNGNFAICNRGSAAVAAGVSLGINLVGTGAVPDPCTAVFATPDPGCAVTTPAGGLKPGQCLNLTCPVVGDKYAILNASGRDVAEPTNCANNLAYASITGGAGCAACVNCDTKVTGTVKDPGKNVGLSGINVYQAATTPITLTDGVSCDTCASLETPYIAAAGTSTSGAFTLSRVTPGTNMTFISQSGRWRRVANINVPACVTTALTDDQIRMPKNKAEGNIPKTAIVQGDQESLECALLKIGVDPAEIAMRVSAADTARFQVYRQNGPTMVAGTPPLASTNLWTQAATLAEYTAVLHNCDGGFTGGNYAFGAGPMATVEAYAAAGGRIFTDHWGPYFMGTTGPTWSATSTWSGVISTPSTAKGRVNTANAAQTLYRDWLFANGASTMWGLGWLQVDNPRKNVVTPNPALATEWIRGANGTFANPEGDWAGNPSGNYALSMSFETPVGSATPCGRVIMNDMHVSQTRMSGGFPYSSSQKFPTNCNLASALSPEEKALEYQIFQLTACALGGSPPPPPPPPPPLPTVTFVRDYSATCPSGTAPVWQLFQWQASIPAGTRIDFRAATSATVAGLPATPGAAPQSVPVGSATADVLAPSWGNDANTVDWHLRNDPPGPPNPSKSNLRIFMTFVPTATVSPALWSWRQLYDCAPAE